MLSKVLIKNLFGMFDYEIHLNESLTIITAPNGYGKTYCLKIIHSIFSYNYFFLYGLNFESIVLTIGDKNLKISKAIRSDDKLLKDSELYQATLFDDITHDMDSDEYIDYMKFTYPKLNSKYISSENTYLNFSLINSKSDEIIYKIDLNFRKYNSELIDSIENSFNLSRIERYKWIERSINRRGILDFETIINEYDLVQAVSKVLPPWLVDFTKDTNSYFIQDQRLLKRVPFENKSDNNSYVKTIQTYAEELKNHIISANLKFSSISQNLDSTFPQRLINSNSNSNSNEIILNDKLQIIEKLNQLQSRREKLKDFDILHQDESFDQIFKYESFDEKYIDVLNLYINDTEEKLSRFDDIFNKINMFVSMLNAKLSFKEVKIDSKLGFYFIRSDNQKIQNEDDPKALDLAQLSSGEQHEVVLIYELIFNIRKGSLVLIDEPEISLHVVWQEQFIRDLKTIMKMNSSSAVIATHSPQIIGDNWENVVDLELLRQKESNLNESK